MGIEEATSLRMMGEAAAKSFLRQIQVAIRLHIESMMCNHISKESTAEPSAS